MSSRKPILCIYHANCLDGYGAYMAVVHAFGTNNVEGRPYNYGEEPPPTEDLIGRTVYIVDFSFPYGEALYIAEVSDECYLFDHHKTAFENLEKQLFPSNMTMVLNNNKSGAVITWDELFLDPPPKLFSYIQDRDLWQFRYDETKPITTWLYGKEWNESLWFEMIAPDADLEPYINIGKEMLAVHDKEVQDLVQHHKGYINIAGKKVPCLNANRKYASDAGHVMAKEAPFAAVYQIGKRGEVYMSLRSDASNGDDVSAVAKGYGGGGHKNAAGFSTNMEFLTKSLR